MNIDDILKKPEFRSLNQFLINEMYSTAGTGLVRKMDLVFKDKEKSRDWFYSNIVALGNRRPYDLCLEGNNSLVEVILNRIEYGIHS